MHQVIRERVQTFVWRPKLGFLPSQTQLPDSTAAFLHRQPYQQDVRDEGAVWRGFFGLPQPNYAETPVWWHAQPYQEYPADPGASWRWNTWESPAPAYAETVVWRHPQPYAEYPALEGGRGRGWPPGVPNQSQGAIAYEMGWLKRFQPVEEIPLGPPPWHRFAPWPVHAIPFVPSPHTTRRAVTALGQQATHTAYGQQCVPVAQGRADTGLTARGQ